MLFTELRKMLLGEDTVEAHAHTAWAYEMDYENTDEYGNPSAVVPFDQLFGP